ncbi:MAG: hypothetical protein ACTSRI_08675 [Promethearchaeota archaeon]
MPNQSIFFRRSRVDLYYNSIGNVIPSIVITEKGKNLKHVEFTYKLKHSTSQDDWQVIIKPNFKPNFHWTPHLTPTNEHVVDQHLFRSPALIATNYNNVLILIPDLDILSRSYETLESPFEKKKPRWYLDLDAPNNIFVTGLCNTRVKEHLLFIRNNEALHPKGLNQFGFYIMYYEDEKIANNPWRKVLDFLWSKWGETLYKNNNPLPPDLSVYVEITYDWAFNRWKEHVWQEFTINGKKVGAPIFINNISQSPNYLKPYWEREFRSIWNQAWFCSLRSASGLYRYAKRTNNEEYLEKAILTKELALSFPQKNGFFPSLIGTDTEKIKIEGKRVSRSKGWDDYFWGNSNRNPFTLDPRCSPYHILDMSWTAFNMLIWYDELERDERLLEYANRYAEALLPLQDEDGFFPAWLDLETLKPMGILDKSPETSLSVTFLLKLFKLTEEKKYLQAAFKAMLSIIKNVIPEGRWEDFETYWSCCRFGLDHIGKKFKRNNIFKQCNFSMFWTAQALLEYYHITDEIEYLRIGQRVLDEMLMTQASWQPPYISVNTLGGFGVMNCDGEWNDARQSLFAELIIQYGVELNCKEYIQRGLAALRASFVMLYCAQIPKTKIQYEKAWDFFNEKDYGFMMENYGHLGITSPDGKGIGDFTIYDWGNGSASEAFNRMIDHFGLNFIVQN